MATISKIGFCKYRLLEGGQNSYVDTNAKEDVAKNRGVQFKFDYSWTGNICTISNIEWNGIKINVNSTTGERTVEAINLSSCYNVKTFPDSDEKYLTISFNGSELVFDENGVEVGTQSVNQYGDENYSKQYTINNAQYMVASFEYSYSTEYVEYYISISNIKIPKTSKYEHNVIFTENGVNELLTNIKNYPIIKIEEIKDSNIWNGYTEGKPCLKVYYGNENKPFGGYVGAGGAVINEVTRGFQYIPVGSNIKFIDPSTESEINSTAPNTWNDGTFRVKINNTTYQVPIKGLTGSGGTFNITAEDAQYAQYDDSEKTNNPKVKISDKYVKKSGDTMTGNLTISKTAAVIMAKNTNTTVYADLESADSGNHGMYSNGWWSGSEFTSSPRWIIYRNKSGDVMLNNSILSNCNVQVTSKENNPFLLFTNTDMTKGTSYQALDPPNQTDNQFYGSMYFGGKFTDSNNNTVSHTASLNSSLGRIACYLNSSNNTHLDFNVTSNLPYDNEGYGITSLQMIYDMNPSGSGYSSYNRRIDTSSNTVFRASKVFNAVFNDYAEYRTTIDLTPGHIVVDQDDGSLTCSTTRLQPGAQVISDTFGHSMGETDTAKTPLAVAGRVLVYTYQPRENYHAGMAVCSAPDGTVDIMTREEIRDYPDCIIGIVSEIPQYETWGTDNVKVDGRIWIKVK